MISSKAQEVEAKRHQVRVAYVKYGFHSDDYQHSFDELHELNMVFMAAAYRRAHGLISNKSKTPYN